MRDQKIPLERVVLSVDSWASGIVEVFEDTAVPGLRTASIFRYSAA
jgi:hypothetical protein